MTARERRVLESDWTLFARPDQLPPATAANGDPWTSGLVMGGRGAGKTRTGAEWVRGLALGQKPFADRPVGRIAIIGETAQEVRDVMIEGVSGLLATHGRGERPVWEPSRRRLEWSNGAVAQTFSAEDPESLRGPQFGAAWLDELAKWRRAEETFDMLQFGLRLGDHPRQVITTTPRPTPLIKRLVADPRTVVTRSKTRANALNLSPAFLDTVVARYAGARLGRQELDGDLIEDRPDALWSRAMIEAARVTEAPPLRRLVVAVDPPVSTGARADACGIVAAGSAADGTLYVIEDATIQGLPPAGWAARVAALYRRLEADAVIVETNQGGDLVAAVLRETDPALPVVPVRATRGKYLRAEPVAILYAQGRVRHVDAFPLLEDELCDFGPAGLTSGRSPDRLDALVWAITALMRGRLTGPRVREI
jgi:phage terminase large subunit-like protein